MIEIFINEPELKYMELIRVALSEESTDLRERAIKNAKHDVVAGRLELLFDQISVDEITGTENTEFLQWVAITSGKRSEAAYEFSVPVISSTLI